MNINEKVAQMLASAKLITIASITEDGYPRPVILSILGYEDGAFYVSTGTSSEKTAHFRANPKAGASIVNEGDSIVYTGTIEIINDEKVKRSLWSDWMYPHFPGGVDDPEYCILKFTPKSSTYWIDNVFIKDGKYMYRFCQSCGMPMQTDDQLGTNNDGSSNEDYCCYCYQKGEFVQDCTMDEMINHCVKYLSDFNSTSNTKFSEEEAIAQMKTFFPKLKRWANDKGQNHKN